MKKTTGLVMALNLILLVWFFLDMIGCSVGGNVLVSRAWKDDFIFFAIYLVALLLFFVKRSIGKYILAIWLFMWLCTQFYFHWWYTIMGPWEGKKNYFSDTLKVFRDSERYVPDLYHIVLHILILCSLIATVTYIKKSRKKIYEN